MGKVASPKLTAAVTNAGGLGCVGGVNFTPRILKLQIQAVKKLLTDPNAPFGVDLLIQKVGSGARATNTDYTKGKLNELIDIIIEQKAKLFVSAVGVAPKHVAKKLHDNGILYMNMVGSPRHVKHALEAGADILCVQGGHTGNIATSCLLPKCIDMVKKRKSLTGRPIYCVAAGGIFDGRGLAMALSYGAEAVWVGTRFVCCTESGATKKHKQNIINARCDDTMKTEIYSGRPLRINKNKYALNWEINRKTEMRKLLKQGILPFFYDLKKAVNASNFYSADNIHLMGQCCGNINDIKTAKQIIDDMM
eukprot:540681_1